MSFMKINSKIVVKILCVLASRLNTCNKSLKHENMCICCLNSNFFFVNGERMCAKYWLPASGRLAQEQCG